MKLLYYRAKSGMANFGDDLNPWFWSHHLPGLWDDDDRIVFVGIGTLLNDQLPRQRPLIIFGSGVGYGKGLPVRDAWWRVYCVRGPQSAKTLGLPPAFALTDPAMLIGRMVAPATRKRYPYSYMPHVVQAGENEPFMREACADLGLHYISPHGSTQTVIDELNQTEILLTEAMHGAIVADALRVPWVPLRAAPQHLSFKWEDWCQSLGLDYQPLTLVPLWQPGPGASLSARLRFQIKSRLWPRQLRQCQRRGRPVLSQAPVLNERLDQLEERLTLFRRDWTAGLISPGQCPPPVTPETFMATSPFD